MTAPALELLFRFGKAAYDISGARLSNCSLSPPNASSECIPITEYFPFRVRSPICRRKLAEIDDPAKREELLQAMARGLAATWGQNLLGEYDFSVNKHVTRSPSRQLGGIGLGTGQ
jgi:hypothetical protein